MGEALVVLGVGHGIRPGLDRHMHGTAWGDGGAGVGAERDDAGRHTALDHGRRRGDGVFIQAVRVAIVPPQAPGVVRAERVGHNGGHIDDVALLQAHGRRGAVNLGHGSAVHGCVARVHERARRVRDVVACDGPHGLAVRGARGAVAVLVAAAQVAGGVVVVVEGGEHEVDLHATRVAVVARRRVRHDTRRHVVLHTRRRHVHGEEVAHAVVAGVGAEEGAVPEVAERIASGGFNVHSLSGAHKHGGLLLESEGGTGGDGAFRAGLGIVELVAEGLGSASEIIAKHERRPR
mmetsp:Transcript_6617/g.13674  ORF Transcript_6617/g.13674 Transcript_6617/m.13674 type:complete len:291 (+) Transcript_6617:1369-2241(+)